MTLCSANIGCAVLSVAVLFAPSIKRTQQLNEALADVAQLGYGVSELLREACQIPALQIEALP